MGRNRDADTKKQRAQRAERDGSTVTAGAVGLLYRKTVAKIGKVPNKHIYTHT